MKKRSVLSFDAPSGVTAALTETLSKSSGGTGGGFGGYGGEDGGGGASGGAANMVAMEILLIAGSEIACRPSTLEVVLALISPDVRSFAMA